MRFYKLEESYSLQEVESKLKQLTSNYTLKLGCLKTSYPEEATIAVKLLRPYYQTVRKIVNPNDTSDVIVGFSKTDVLNEGIFDVVKKIYRKLKDSNVSLNDYKYKADTLTTLDIPGGTNRGVGSDLDDSIDAQINDIHKTIKTLVDDGTDNFLQELAKVIDTLAVKLFKNNPTFSYMGDMLWSSNEKDHFNLTIKQKSKDIRRDQLVRLLKNSFSSSWIKFNAKEDVIFNDSGVQLHAEESRHGKKESDGVNIFDSLCKQALKDLYSSVAGKAWLDGFPKVINYDEDKITYYIKINPVKKVLEEKLKQGRFEVINVLEKAGGCVVTVDGRKTLSNHGYTIETSSDSEDKDTKFEEVNKTAAKEQLNEASSTKNDEVS